MREQIGRSGARAVILSIDSPGGTVVAALDELVRQGLSPQGLPAQTAIVYVSPLKALSSPWAVFGALAIFLYVGAEVAIGGMLTNFLESPDVLNAPIETAGKMVALYWGGAMIGRFIGSAVLTRVPAGIVLAFCTVVAALLCLIVSQVGGPTAAYAALSIGLFNSIMFPTIFSLASEKLGARAADAQQALADRPVAVDDPRRGGVLDHRVLAGDLVGGNRYLRHFGDVGQHVEVVRGGLHHDQVSSLGEIEEGLAHALPAVRRILLVSFAIALEGAVDGVTEGAEEGRGVLG